MQIASETSFWSVAVLPFAKEIDFFSVLYLNFVLCEERAVIAGNTVKANLTPPFPCANAV